MDFDFTEEQNLLVQSLERSLAKSFPFETYHAQVKDKITHSPDMWGSLAELGIMAMPLPERAGGFDGNHVDVMCICTELGRRLVTEPYISSAVIAGYMLEATGGATAEKYLPLIATGEATFAVGLYEPSMRHNPLATHTQAKASGGSWLLTGHKAVVLGADSAGYYIISAATTEGTGLFLVSAGATGVECKKYQLLDGRGAAELLFTSAEGTLLGTLGDKTESIILAAADRAGAALAADTLGAMEEVSEMTKDYLRTRTQFGRPIGSFQVLSHRMVDLLIDLEQAKSITMDAAVHATSENTVERQKAVSAAKQKVGKASRKFAQECIQLHGGIGMTDEYALGSYVKRMLVNEMLFGDADYHLKRFASL